MDLEIVKQSIDLDDELPAPEIGTKIKRATSNNKRAS